VNPTDDPYNTGITAAPPAATTDDPYNTGIKAMRSGQRAAAVAGQRLDQKIGGALQYGRAHPFEAVLGVLGTPQRALEAIETGNDLGHAITHFSDRDKLSRAVRDKIGLTDLEQGALAGSDIWHKLARAGLDFGVDAINDPLNIIPVGKLTELGVKGAAQLGKSVPAIGKAAETISKPARWLLDPDYYLRGVTPEGKAQFEQATNRAMEHVRAVQRAEDAIVKKHAAAIRAGGQMPDEIARLFAARNKDNSSSDLDAWKQYFADPETGALPAQLPKGTRPQSVASALFRDRAPLFAKEVLPNAGRGGNPELEHFFKDPSGYRAGGVNPYQTTDPATIKIIQQRLRSAIESKTKPESTNALLKAAHEMTRRSNQAFLANPVPHVANLTDLTYKHFGPMTAAKGLANAVKVASGKVDPELQSTIDEMRAGGAHSQYGNIFDEIGLTRLLGIPGTEGAAGAVNKAIIPLQRASNYAQHKVLNSAETGLRAAALDALRARSVTGPQAMRDLHSAFGTDAPNKLTEGAEGLGSAFSKFGLQTALGAGLHALAHNPQRLSAPLKADLDYNAEVNPGNSPKYVMTNPTASTAKALADPQDYFAQHALGPFYSLAKGYSALSQVQKGKVVEAAGDLAKQYGAGSDELGTLLRMLTHQRGEAGERASSDIGPDILGGYFAKPKR
jgi:hypothetical protein